MYLLIVCVLDVEWLKISSFADDGALIWIWVKSTAPVTFRWFAAARKAFSLASSVGWSAGKDVNFVASVTHVFVQSVTEVTDECVPRRHLLRPNLYNQAQARTHSTSAVNTVTTVQCKHRHSRIIISVPVFIVMWPPFLLANILKPA